MDELIRWTDNAPTLRRFEISFNGSDLFPYSVRVWDTDHRSGEAKGKSLNFAAVKALIAYDEKRVAP